MALDIDAELDGNFPGADSASLTYQRFGTARLGIKELADGTNKAIENLTRYAQLRRRRK